jgi:zinc and cadmium transporter
MATYFDVIFFSLIGGLFSLFGGILLLSKKSVATKLAMYATPFAAGALLAAVFFDLLPEGIEADTNPQTVLTWTLVGIVLFFILERFLTWFHHHHEHIDSQNQSKKSLIVIGDTIHNALDGVVIATAFLISVPVGIVTTIAVALHEIPQEVGDFGLLLSRGMSRKKVLLANIFSALSTTVLAVITFALGSEDKLPIGAMLGISAGFLLYIATSDIIPSIHEHTPKNKLFDIRPILLLVGIVVVGVVIEVSKKYGA